MSRPTADNQHKRKWQQLEQWDEEAGRSMIISKTSLSWGEELRSVDSLSWLVGNTDSADLDTNG